MSVRTLHAETLHALRIAGRERDLCCLEHEHWTDEKCCPHSPTVKNGRSLQPKKRREAITVRDFKDDTFSEKTVCFGFSTGNSSAQSIIIKSGSSLQIFIMV